MNDTKLIGVDIGGTKINTALINQDSVVKRWTTKTPAQESEEFVLNTVVESIRQLITPDVKGIGIGVPGMVDSANGIVKQVQNIPAWKNVKLREYIEKEFNIPVFIDNDANCFVAGEKFFGNAKSYSNFLGITLGTGLGSGILINNSLYNSIGVGEIGYLPYKESVFEHYCSSQFFSKFYQTTGLEVYNKVLLGDKEAQGIMNEFGSHLGELIKQITYILAPEAIVFGGSISKSFPVFEKSMWKSIHDFPFDVSIEDLKIFPSELNDISVLGAASLYYNYH